MAAWWTGSSGTVVSALATGSMACSAAPAPLPMITRRRIPARSGLRRDDHGERGAAGCPAYRAEGDHDAFPGRDGKFCVCRAADPADTILATLTWAAPCGADSTSVDDRPGPVRLSATTPCSSMAGAAAVNVPSAPPPPGISTEGDRGVGGQPERGRDTAQRRHGDLRGGTAGQVDPAGPGRLVAPREVTAVTWTVASFTPGTAMYSSRLPATRAARG